MSFGDEIKGDALKTVAILGAVLGFVALFTLYSISIWLVVVVAVIGGAVYFYGKSLFGR